MKQFLLCVGISLVSVCMVHAQSSHQNNFQNITPPTPEVAAFAKSVDIPMNYGSGLPQIGIPFYTIKTGNITVPISLSYNASGIRVEEQATRVGLGWNLSTGPTLTRSMRGLPDESGNGLMFSTSTKTIRYVDSMRQLCVAAYDPLTQCPQNAYLLDIDFDLTNNALDLETDIFSFSAFGYSGKFYWSQDSAKFIVAPYQKIKIEYERYTLTSVLGFQSFTLTLPNGIVCYFGGSFDHQERLQSAYSQTLQNGYAYNATIDPVGSYNTSWAINTVTDYNGKLVKYHYTKNTVLEYGRGGESWSHDPILGTPGHSTNFYKQTYSKPVLTKISSDDADILFLSGSTAREDVVNLESTIAKSLDTILIKNKEGTEIKSYLLYYSYRTSSDSTEIDYLINYKTIARKRLYLDSIKEKNITTGLAFPPHRFKYHPLNLPNRLSSSQDFWGYYNGKENGIFTIPRRPILGLLEIGVNDLPMLQDTSWPYNADRRIDSAFTKAGLLTTIYYPTGGSTSYTYEPNEVPRYFYKKDSGIEPPDMLKKEVAFVPLFPSTPPFPTYYSQNFTVTNPATKIKIKLNMPPPCSHDSDPSCRYSIHIKSLPDSAISHSYYTTGTVFVQLPMGEYKIVGLYTNLGDSMPNFGAILNWGEHPDSNIMRVGGLRVKKIISADSVNNTVQRRFSYISDSLTTVSSGVLSGMPCHALYIYSHPSFDPLAQIFNVSPSKIQSNSAIPLTTDGQLVRYTDVTEYYDTAGTSFKTNYKYYTDLNTAFYFDKIGAPGTTKEWQNNILRSKTSYEKTGTNTYRPLSYEYHTYQPDSMKQFFGGSHTRQLIPFEVATEWFTLQSSESTVYTYNSGTQTSASNTNYYYNDSFMVARTRTINSKGDTVENKTWYPYDYSTPTGFNIPDLKSKYIIAIPIKQETTVNSKLVNGSVIKYNSNGQPVEVYAYENSSLANPSTHNAGTGIPTNYFLKTSVYYNTNKDLSYVVPSSGTPVSYIWIHGINSFTSLPEQIQPVAEVQNALPSDIAYTSFENGYILGNWSISGVTVYTGTDNGGLTGKRHHSGSISIFQTGLKSHFTYLVTYWSKQSSTPYSITGTISGWPKLIKSVNLSGTTWYCYEHRVTGQTTITLSGTGDIDELRLYPETAFMSTNYQIPGIGVSASCNANNQLVFYEYDGLGRLHLIRDENRNILKKVCYNFHGQQTGCSEQFSLPARPDPCATCTGNDKKCINGVCETGVPVLHTSVRTGQSTWNCTYYYVFSDNTNTLTTYTYTVVKNNGLCN